MQPGRRQLQKQAHMKSWELYQVSGGVEGFKVRMEMWVEGQGLSILVFLRS